MMHCVVYVIDFFFFKQKTAYEMRISDWSSDVCSSDLDEIVLGRRLALVDFLHPLLDRHLDAEFLVDGEGDVEKIQAVDTEIIDRVGLRPDGLAVDAADFCNDVRDCRESIAHRLGIPFRQGGFWGDSRRVGRAWQSWRHLAALGGTWRPPRGLID